MRSINTSTMPRISLYKPEKGKDYDFLDKTRAACPEGVDVVYDSIGAATAESSLQTLKPRGTCVFFGNSSGAPKPIAPTPTLAKLGSLYITRPLLEHYMRTPEERRRRAEETFGWVADGKVKVRIAKEFDGLGEAAAAHEFLESRQAKGKVPQRTRKQSCKRNCSGHTSAVLGYKIHSTAPATSPAHTGTTHGTRTPCPQSRLVGTLQ